MMKKTISHSLLLASAFLVLTAQKCGETKYEYTSETVIEMAKTGCFGECPSYSFTLKGDGQSTFNGRQFVPLEGAHSRTFAADTTNAFFSELLALDLFKYENEYTDPNVMDLPTTYLTFMHEGKKKKIKLYYDYPEELEKLAERIQALAFSKGWTGSGGSSAP
jgi:hypothetical protein